MVLAFSGIAMSQSIQSIIHKDGSFDLIGTSVKITNCYPALDNQFVAVEIQSINKTV